MFLDYSLTRLIRGSNGAVTTTGLPRLTTASACAAHVEDKVPEPIADYCWENFHNKIILAHRILLGNVLHLNKAYSCLTNFQPMPLEPFCWAAFSTFLKISVRINRRYESLAIRPNTWSSACKWLVLHLCSWKRRMLFTKLFVLNNFNITVN